MSNQVETIRDILSNSEAAGLLKLANYLDSSENEVLVGAENEKLDIVADALVSAASILRLAAEKIEKKYKLLNSNTLEEMAVIADEFDKSGDPLLQKQASVIDEILLSVGAGKFAIEKFKQSQDNEVENLRKKYREQALESKYKDVNKAHKEEYRAASDEDPAKAIEKKVKEYRPLEASLNTRYCPDHPGVQIMRIADSTYQCELDKQIYNYEAGYTTMAGNKVPGTDVSNQTQFLGHRAPEHSNFSTREQALNSSD